MFSFLFHFFFLGKAFWMDDTVRFTDLPQRTVRSKALHGLFYRASYYMMTGWVLSFCLCFLARAEWLRGMAFFSCVARSSDLAVAFNGALVALSCFACFVRFGLVKFLSLVASYCALVAYTGHLFSSFKILTVAKDRHQMANVQ